MRSASSRLLTALRSISWSGRRMRLISSPYADLVSKQLRRPFLVLSNFHIERRGQRFDVAWHVEHLIIRRANLDNVIVELPKAHRLVNVQQDVKSTISVVPLFVGSRHPRRRTV